MHLIPSLTLACGLLQAPATAQPTPVELVVPAGVEIMIQASNVSAQHRDNQTQLELRGSATIRLSNGVQLRMERLRLRIPDNDNVARERRLLIEPLAVAVQAAEAQAESFAGLGLLLKPGGEGEVEIAEILGQAGDDVKEKVNRGDLITHVDGKSLKELKLEEVAKLIRGEEGTTVRLTLKRPGEDKAIEATLKRKVIKVEG